MGLLSASVKRALGKTKAKSKPIANLRRPAAQAMIKRPAASQVMQKPAAAKAQRTECGNDSSGQEGEGEPEGEEEGGEDAYDTSSITSQQRCFSFCVFMPPRPPFPVPFFLSHFQLSLCLFF